MKQRGKEDDKINVKCRGYGGYVGVKRRCGVKRGVGSKRGEG